MPSANPQTQERLSAPFFMRSNAWECAKKTNFEEVLRKRRECRYPGAEGDNCSGPPNFEPTSKP